MDLTSKVKEEQLFQLKKLWLDVAKVSYLYIYFAWGTTAGLHISICSQAKGVIQLEIKISTQSHLGNVMK